MKSSTHSPIGVFDSGYGGLTILRELVRQLPQYDYLYLGDNARAPYGTRSFDTVHRFTLQCVRYLFDQGCPLVILACNTASAKALRTIQQQDLPLIDPSRRVLGVIRPSVEAIGKLTKTRKVGILGTPGTVKSASYVLEIAKLFPNITVYQESCPMWVPLVENGEHNSPGADFFVRQHIDGLMAQCPEIDAVVLGCTHYPLLTQTIRKHLPAHVTLVSQGEIVATSLSAYLRRHPAMAGRCSQTGSRAFMTTDDPEVFSVQAAGFFGEKVRSESVVLG